LEAFLVEHFPGASVANRPAGWTGEFRASATFNINKTLKNFSELDLVNRTEITLLFVVGLLTVLGPFLVVFGLVWPWSAVLSLVGFTAAVSLTMPRASIRVGCLVEKGKDESRLKA
jgi:uncharacterized membrane protein YphA (DoxX/SURF4 family)